MIKEKKEIAQFIAELETTFKLPVESEALKNRYENLQRINKEVAKLEDRHTKISAENLSNFASIQAITHRRDFLSNLYHSLLKGTKLRKNASNLFATTETKVKNEIMQLEETLQSRQLSIGRLQHQLNLEEKKLKNAKETVETNKEICQRNESDLAELEAEKTTLKAVFDEDQKVVEKMEEYFFKVTTNLFELQRELDKRTLHLTHQNLANAVKKDTAADGDDDEIAEVTSLNKGWHRISHIMEEMGKDQARYLKMGADQHNFEDSNQLELKEEEKQWLKQELKIQKQKMQKSEEELKHVVNETKTLTKEFLNVIEEAEILLQKYAAVECKNMTTDLRNARLQILASATKYEPETPMYKKYHETIEESALASEKPEFQELYDRKVENAKIASEEAEKFDQQLRRCKVNIRKDLYWMDKKPNDKEVISEIKESIEKMDSTLLKEFLRALIFGGNFSTSESSETPLPDSTASQLTKFLKEMTVNRNRKFEIHLKKCLQIYSDDIKRISDEASDLENSVRSLEKSLAEMKKEKEKEEELCGRLEERIRYLQMEEEKKKEKDKEKDDEKEKQWIKEIQDLENKLFEATESRDEARKQKLQIQEAIRATQIEENNLKHRFNVFQSLKKAEKEGRKQFENSKQLFEAEQAKNLTLAAETEAMAKILEEALKQESKLEKAIEGSYISDSISEEHQALEAEKKELEAELEYLLSIEQKITSK